MFVRFAALSFVLLDSIVFSSIFVLSSQMGARLSPQIRGKILAFRRAHFNILAIAKKVSVSKSSVLSVIHLKPIFLPSIVRHTRSDAHIQPIDCPVIVSLLEREQWLADEKLADRLRSLFGRSDITKNGVRTALKVL